MNKSLLLKLINDTGNGGHVKFAELMYIFKHTT
jgi:hypothetical protein